MKNKPGKLIAFEQILDNAKQMEQNERYSFVLSYVRENFPFLPSDSTIVSLLLKGKANPAEVIDENLDNYFSLDDFAIYNNAARFFCIDFKYGIVYDVRENENYTQLIKRGKEHIVYFSKRKGYYITIKGKRVYKNDADIDSYALQTHKRLRKTALACIIRRNDIES